jgi:hypothetical protein
MTTINTIHALISKLEKVSPRLASLDLCSTVQDEQIEAERFEFANNGDEIALVGRALEQLPAPEAALRKMMTDLLSRQNFYGQLCEFAWYYPFKTSRQFHRTSAFVLVFSFSPGFNGLMSVDFDGSTGVFLRSLARRAFFQTKGDANADLELRRRGGSGRYPGSGVAIALRPAFSELRE